MSNINVKGMTNHSYASTLRLDMDFPMRVLLYSHDSVGLGHLRRNLAIARQINATFPKASILIVTGSPCASQFPLPDNTDMIKIPSISKDEHGNYVPLDRSMSLDETVAFRSDIILETDLKQVALIDMLDDDLKAAFESIYRACIESD